MTSPVEAGFDTTQLGRSDDAFSSSISLGFSLNFFGTTYSTAYVSNNGYVTFGAGQSNYSSAGLGSSYSGKPIIAALFADVDTRNTLSGITSWGTGTFEGHAAFGATWPAVGYFSNGGDKLDTFQILLVDRSDVGTGDFDIYLNYGGIQWSNTASAGYNAGISHDPAGTYFQLPGSLTANAFLNNGSAALTASTNDGTPGQWLFSVRDGLVGAPVAGPSYAIAATDADKADATSGLTNYTFTVTRTGDTSAATSLSYAVTPTGPNPNDSLLFANTSGTVQFAAGSNSAVISVAVNPANITVAKGFTVALEGAVGITIATPTASGVIEPNASLNTDVIHVSPTSIAVMRFFDQGTGSHFFTASANEDNTMSTDAPSMSGEGTAFLALSPETVPNDANAVGVYRFFDSNNGSHFFTDNADERASIIATQPTMIDEGVGFYEHTVQQAGDTAVYRFFDASDGSHFFTQNAAERASIIASRADMVDEGIAFYASSH